jgi:hypothetical protein
VGISRRSGGVVEDDQLTVGFERGGGDERFPGEDTGIGDEVARGRMVGAVEDEVVAGEGREGFFRGEVDGVAVVFHEGVEAVFYIRDIFMRVSIG